MARKRLYVSDVQAQVDDLRGRVNYWVDKYVELQAQELWERVERMWENGDWSGPHEHLADRVSDIEQRYPGEWSFINKEHDKLLNEVRELRAQVKLLTAPRPSLFRRFLSFFKA